jgi:hypothetical protein
MLPNKRNSPAWREFERLAAFVEEVLGPKGASVKSPDKVRDLLTKRKREVDASIRYKIGSVPLLITIECRKRGRSQDDTWIEQLAKKKEKIGAAKTIAVSSNGFSSSALKTAEFYGIETRIIKEVSARDIVSWCEMEYLHYCPPRIRVTSITLADDTGKVISLDHICTALGIPDHRLNSNTPFLASDEGHFTVNDLIGCWQREHHTSEKSLTHGVVPQGPPIQRIIHAELEPKKYWLVGTDRRYLSRIHLIADVSVDLIQIPVNRRYRYSGPDGEISEGAEYVIPTFGGTPGDMRFLLQRVEGRIGVHVKVEQQQANR